MNATTQQPSASREHILDRLVDGATGGAAAVLLALLVAAVAGSSSPRLLSVLFLVGSVILAAGFGAFGARARIRGRASEAHVALMAVIIWLAFALVQVGMLATCSTPVGD
jgi:hypothetical protein